MKRILILLLYIIGTFHIANAQQIANLTKENAWQIVQEKIVGNKKDSVNVYVSNSIVKANSAIITMNGKEISPIFDSWFFFIDDMPYDNWSHPCRYVFVNIYNGELVLNHRSSPPLTDNMQSLVSYNMNSSPQILFNIKKKQLPSKSQSVFPYEHEYAVIISGGGNANFNYERYWNDCSAIYQTLINIYGFSKNNIYVLMSDGTDPGLDRHMNNGTYQSSPLDLDGDGVSDIQYAATLSNISNVFNYLSSILTSDDNLFVFTTDHGSQINEQHVVMTLWNNSELHDYTFASYINNMNANTIKICMGQCNSGGFIDNITRNNVIISTACRYDEPSHSASNNLYDEFIYHWISAVFGETPTGTFVNADSNNDGIVSMSEAFDYANTHDTKNEHPQYFSSPTSLGNLIDLGSNLVYNINGSSVCYNTETYNVIGLSTAYTVNWSLSGANASCYTVHNNTPSTNQCTVTLKDSVDFVNTNDLVLNAQIKYGSTVITTVTKPLTPFFYIYGPTIPYSTSSYEIGNLPDDCTVSWNWSGTGLTIDNTPILVEPYYSTNNYFKLVRNNLDYARGTLTATINRSGNTVATISKTLDTGVNFSGTWYQGTGSSSTLTCGNVYSVTSGSQVHLYSNDFIGKAVTYSNHGLFLLSGGVSHSGNTISFTPVLSVFHGDEPYAIPYLGKSVTIQVTDATTYEAFEFTFYIEPQHPSNPPILSMAVSGNEYTFTYDEASESRQTWALEVVKIDTGQVVYDGTTDMASQTIMTSNWQSGIYAVLVRRNGQIVATQKITIQ